MKRLEIHNKVTAEQLALQPGDEVIVTRDDGREEVRVVRGWPTKMGGHTWVLWLKGISGDFALCRVRPTAAAEPER